MKKGRVEIVLIEDNAGDVELTLHALRKRNLANSVKVINDGEEALDYLLTSCSVSGMPECPHLILLDLKLPKISGLELLEKIRSDERTKMIPVVVLTTSSEERDVVESFRLSVAGYIIKPVDYRNFVEAVRTIDVYWTLSELPEEKTEDANALCQTHTAG